MRCETQCTYSNTLQQSKPRKCLVCGEREEDWKGKPVITVEAGQYNPQDLPLHSDPIPPAIDNTKLVAPALTIAQAPSLNGTAPHEDE